jgi:hypothetical protein
MINQPNRRLISKSKCDFCAYKVGNECTAAKANGQTSSYYCTQAQYEYNQWLRQQKQKLKPKSWH